MVWTAPMTAVDGVKFSSQDYNLYIRDNMLQQAPAKVTALSQYFITDGFRSLAARNIADAFQANSGTTTSTSYTTTLSGTPGTNPSVTVTTDVSALVFFAVAMSNNTTDALSCASVGVTGASNVKPHNHWRIIHDGKTLNNVTRTMGIHRFAAELKKGSNTFTLHYKVGSNTGTFSRRYICVMPL